MDRRIILPGEPVFLRLSLGIGGHSWRIVRSWTWIHLCTRSLLSEFALIAAEPELVPETRALAYLMGLCLVKLNYECRERHGSLTWPNQITWIYRPNASVVFHLYRRVHGPFSLRALSLFLSLSLTGSQPESIPAGPLLSSSTRPFVKAQRCI